MKMTNEQIQQILDGAPEGWTHYCTRNRWYFKRDGNTDYLRLWVTEIDGWSVVLASKNRWLERRERLEEIIELRQEVERLKAQQSEVAARAVEGFASELKERAKLIPLGAENKSKGAATYNWQMFYAEVAENYANQLREQSNV